MFPADTTPADARTDWHPNPYTTGTYGPQVSLQREQLEDQQEPKPPADTVWPESAEGWLAHFG